MFRVYYIGNIENNKLAKTLIISHPSACTEVQEIIIS